jgi:carboxymethylenebutenolidase
MEREEDNIAVDDRNEFSRRDFVRGVLAAGFAAAVQPIAADTVITTDSKGLTAGEIRIPTSDREIPGYRAMPEKGTNFPTVLVVSEIFGAHEHIRDVCRRLAKLGYLAVAPELFVRQGDVYKIKDIPTIMQTVIPKVPDAQVLGDLDATVAWALKNHGNAAKLGITGFCWGGRIVWLYCAHNPNVKAGVAWYGRLTGQTGDLQPSYPLDVAATIKPPVLGLYGGADQGIPLESVEKMRAALKATGNKSEIVVYPDTPHAFNADYRPSYRKEPAEDGWKRMQAWFKTHGVS